MRNKVNYFLAHAFWVLFVIGILAYGIHAIYSVGYQAGKAKSSNTQLVINPVADDDGSYDGGYDDGRREGYEKGYSEGFNYASNAIIDSMDPDYRQQWWNENIDMITELGIKY